MTGTRTSFADHDCGFAQAIESIGDQWSFLIIRNLFMGMTRFEDFAAHLSISPKVLTNRLQRLTDEGLIASRADERDGRAKIYELTDKGADLGPIVGALTQWGDKWVPKPGGARSEIFELATGEAVARVTVVSKSGKMLSPDEIGHRTGPGGSRVRDELDQLVAKRLEN